MNEYIVNVHADGGWEFHVEVKASNESEALSEVVEMLRGKWVDLENINGKSSRLRTDRVINLTVIEKLQTRFL